MNKFKGAVAQALLGNSARDKGTLCPTCMKPIKQDSRIEVDIKYGTVRHAKCVELKPMQKKALRELDNVMKSIKIRGL